MVSRSQTRIDRSGRSSLRKSKSLAVQTAKATADVGRQISVIQEGMHQSVNEITAVGCPSLQTREVVVACAPRQQTQTGARASELVPRTDRGGHGGGSRLPKRDLLPALRSHLSDNLLPFA